MPCLVWCQNVSRDMIMSYHCSSFFSNPSWWLSTWCVTYEGSRLLPLHPPSPLYQSFSLDVTAKNQNDFILSLYFDIFILCSCILLWSLPNLGSPHPGFISGFIRQPKRHFSHSLKIWYEELHSFTKEREKMHSSYLLSS